MVSLTRRTAGCGPAYPVVWQGRVGDHSPYADLEEKELRRARAAFGFAQGKAEGAEKSSECLLMKPRFL